ncbi:hypothetical protein I552_6092 [Mycobacterium xenopi 3993]|nr:hypothetical protein I552_6092 [Mycobacterium xenopi 3993]
MDRYVLGVQPLAMSACRGFGDEYFPHQTPPGCGFDEVGPSARNRCARRRRTWRWSLAAATTRPERSVSTGPERDVRQLLPKAR